MSKNEHLSTKSWRLAGGVGLLVAALGVGWILRSDALLAMVSCDPGWLQSAQRYKGLFHVAMTALAPVLLVRAGYAALERATDEAHARDQALQLASHKALPARRQRALGV